MSLSCANSQRRRDARARQLSGIDYVDYVRHPSPQLMVYFFGPLPEGVSASSFAIEGGRRMRDLRITAVELQPDASALLYLSAEGDASFYTLRLLGELPGVDPRYASVRFSFKIDCPGELDCTTSCHDTQPDPPAPAPKLDYLAKDYASFRQLLLERLSLTLPSWRERHLPDVGVALVELLAYVGDQLSYRQDAVATEAYLNTARLRTSVRRHARLVDYPMHEGCNARAWVVLCVDRDVSWETARVRFTTRIAGLSEGMIDERTAQAAEQPYQVFLPVSPEPKLHLRAALGRIRFYTWGGEQCSIARGATSATLRIDGESATPPLWVGQILLFEEVVGPRTGRAAEADPTHRHVVRLTRVSSARDPLLSEQAAALYDVCWDEADALPFAMCLSSLDPEAGCAPIHDVSIARGNVILVDHGDFFEEDLGEVGSEPMIARCEGPLRTAFQDELAAPFEPRLTRVGLSFVAAYSGGPASAALRSDPTRALPSIALTSTLVRDPACGTDSHPLRWQPRRDLLASSGDDLHFVVDNDDDGISSLRFGDGVGGRRPAPQQHFRARYRVGNGPAGNVASEAIAQLIVTGEPAGGVHVRVRNPLPAQGGVAPEPVDEVRERAPYALHARRERAIVADDYAELAQRELASMQQTTAALRWTGSWYEALVGLDPLHGEHTPPALLASATSTLERYRRIGHDLRVAPAHYVSLWVELSICVEPHSLRAHVAQAAQRELIGRKGSPAFFAPDQLSFAQRISLSALVARVQAVTGVHEVIVQRFERLGEGDRGELDAGELVLDTLDVARLDNDPARPENGLLTLHLRGGR
jgi:hypothetical protein